MYGSGFIIKAFCHDIYERPEIQHRVVLNVKKILADASVCPA